MKNGESLIDTLESKIIKIKQQNIENNDKLISE